MFQIEIKGVAGINMSWVEFFSKINKRPGPIIPDSKVTINHLNDKTRLYL